MVTRRRPESDNGAEDMPPIIAEAEGVDLQGEASASIADDLLADKCQKCGLALEYSGRGRHPTQCKKGEGCRANEPTITAMAGKRGTAGDIERIRENMLELYIMLGFGVAAFDQHDGMVISQSAPKLADSWANLAANDPKVRKALLRFMSGSSWAGVIAAHALVALPIAQHHNLLPMKREPSMPTP